MGETTASRWHGSSWQCVCGASAPAVAAAAVRRRQLEAAAKAAANDAVEAAAKAAAKAALGIGRDRPGVWGSPNRRAKSEEASQNTHHTHPHTRPVAGRAGHGTFRWSMANRERRTKHGSTLHETTTPVAYNNVVTYNENGAVGTRGIRPRSPWTTRARAKTRK